MKVLFIYPDIGSHQINFCPAIHILSAVIKNIGCYVNMLHINDNYGVKYDHDAIMKEAEGYDLYAFTATSFTYKYANEIAGWLKEYKKITILGGCHATIQPEDFDTSNFDIFCVGEGEEPLKNLIFSLQNGTDYSKISGLITTKGVNPVSGFLKDLNELPFNDYDISDTDKILELKYGWFSISFSRGCPFACTFCINKLYKKIELRDGKMSEYIRKRTPLNAVTEMEVLAIRYDVKVFNLDDDLLTMDKKWMKEFTDLYAEKVFIPYGVKYAINSRASFLNEEMVKMLSYSGCQEVRIGFETGNEELRNRILGKHISNEDLISACHLLEKYGIKSDLFAMMGIPGETWDTFMDTVQMVIRMKPSLIRMTFLHPYKHTEIYDYCVGKNLFKQDYNTDNDRFESPLIFPDLTNEEIFCFKFLFGWYVNSIMNDSDPYVEAIDNYRNIPYEILRTKVPEIIETDQKLSENCKVPHYRYFPKNTNYIEYYDPRKKVLVN